MRLLTICLTASLLAADWPQWRGPNRDGIAPDYALPSDLPKKLTKVWSAEVGEGHSSPIVVGSQVFQFARRGDDEVLSCHNVADGKEIWTVKNKVEYKMHSAATGHGKGPKSTPVHADGRVFTLGISGILSCVDAKTGKLNWRKDFSTTFPKTSPLYGTAMSPIVYEGVVIAHVGGHDKGSLAGFDVKTGAQKWSASSDGPGYASPILVEIEKQPQIVTQTQNDLVGIDPKAGKLLWSIPFKTDYDQNSVTVIDYENTLYYSGVSKPITQIKVVRQGGTWKTGEGWKNKDFPLYMSSPIRVGHKLYGMSQKSSGTIFAIDLSGGTADWTSEGRAGDNASLTVVGKKLLVLSTTGQLSVLDLDATKYQPLAEYAVAETPVWASPAPIKNGILVKDLKSLTRWNWQSE